MAADAQLLREAEQNVPGLRIYLWDGPWVSLGRFQEPENALVEGWGRWVKRPTGGKAVLHGHDVTVALAYPRSNRTRSVREIYRELTTPLIGALNDCGVWAELGGEASAQSEASGEDCFAFTSPYDIVERISGEKICGCAMRVTSKAALLQVSIPYMSPLVDPGAAIVGGEAHNNHMWSYGGFAAAMQREWACHCTAFKNGDEAKLSQNALPPNTAAAPPLSSARGVGELRRTGGEG